MLTNKQAICQKQWNEPFYKNHPTIQPSNRKMNYLTNNPTVIQINKTSNKQTKHLTDKQTLWYSVSSVYFWVTFQALSHNRNVARVYVHWSGELYAQAIEKEQVLSLLRLKEDLLLKANYYLLFMPSDVH